MSIFVLAIIALGIAFWQSRRAGLSESAKKVWQAISAILLLIVLVILGYALYLVT